MPNCLACRIVCLSRGGYRNAPVAKKIQAPKPKIAEIRSGPAKSA